MQSDPNDEWNRHWLLFDHAAKLHDHHTNMMCVILTTLYVSVQCIMWSFAIQQWSMQEITASMIKLDAHSWNIKTANLY